MSTITTSGRITCHRYSGADDLRASEVAHDERADFLARAGWTRKGADSWAHPERGAAYSEAAAVREALREEVAR